MRLPRTTIQVRLWLLGLFLLCALLLWGGLQDEDPLAPYIADDAMRHILGFGTLGLIAAFVRQPALRAGALLTVFFFAFAFEVLQGPFSPRNASWDDLLASSIGALAGFGLGAQFLTLTAAVRSLRRPCN